MPEAVVVGAGMTELSVAWFLQNHGFDVEVIDRVGVAGGSSWGNAGWLAPGKTIPLAHPSLWRYGPTALFDPNAALAVPPRIDPRLWAFCARFMAHATRSVWDETMAALTPADKLALAAYDELVDGGVEAQTHTGDYVAAFRDEKEAGGFIGEIEGAVRHGQEISFEHIDRDAALGLAPVLSEAARAVYRIGGQRYIEPGPFCEAIAESVRARGGRVTTGVAVTEVNSTRKPVLELSTGEYRTPDTVVLAAGAWLPELARRLGVRTMVQAGRGYSFSVPTETPVEHPIYLPEQRVACTPYQGRLRIAGTMEFRGPDEAFQPARIDSVVEAVRPMFTGVDLDDRKDEWVGSRPVTPDGLPLIGATKAPNVYTTGGHGMWGVVLGPVSGKLLAEQIATGRVDPVLKPFDPLR